MSDKIHGLHLVVIILFWKFLDYGLPTIKNW